MRVPNFSEEVQTPTHAANRVLARGSLGRKRQGGAVGRRRQGPTSPGRVRGHHGRGGRAWLQSGEPVSMGATNP